MEAGLAKSFARAAYAPPSGIRPIRPVPVTQPPGIGAKWVHSPFQLPSPTMTLCPIALAVGCKKCPIFAVCPVKTIIGDYKPAVGENKKSQARQAKGGGKK